MQELEKIFEEIEAEHPYKVPGNYDSYSQYNEAWSDAIYRVRARLEEFFQEKDNDGWIPAEERLSKTNGTYNVTRHIDGHFISDSAYFDGQNTWHSDNRVNHSRPYLTDVIAWRPLPEPYRQNKQRRVKGVEEA